MLCIAEGQRKSLECSAITTDDPQLVQGKGHVSCRAVEMLNLKAKLFKCTECLINCFISRYLASCRNHFDITVFVEEPKKKKSTEKENKQMDYGKEQLKLNASCILQRELNEKDPCKGNNKEKSPCTQQQKVHFSRRGHYKTKPMGV